MQTRGDRGREKSETHFPAAVVIIKHVRPIL